ncbi:hypothetical protein B0T20DRAFT_494649, partial [Sordaria brevicollis]
NHLNRRLTRPRQFVSLFQSNLLHDSQSSLTHLRIYIPPLPTVRQMQKNKLNPALDLAVLRSQLGSDMDDALDVERVIQESQQAMQELEQRISALRDKFGDLETSFQNLEEEWEEVDDALAIQQEKGREFIAWGLRKEKSRREEEEEEEKKKRNGGGREEQECGGNLKEVDGDKQGGDGRGTAEKKDTGKKEEEEDGRVADEDGEGPAGGDEEDKKRKRKDSGNSNLVFIDRLFGKF